MTPAAVAAALDVSRETLDRLEALAALLMRWQAKMNLVAASSLDDLWRRHIYDSAQVLPRLAGQSGPLYDLGSGAGFPGLVLAILGVPGVHLVESNTRKCAFLREAARATETEISVLAARIEDLPPARGAAIVTARALAPLPALLAYAAPLLRTDGRGFFWKGSGVNEELTESRKMWKMRVERIASRSDPSGTILQIEGISQAR